MLAVFADNSHALVKRNWRKKHWWEHRATSYITERKRESEASIPPCLFSPLHPKYGFYGSPLFTNTRNLIQYRAYLKTGNGYVRATTEVMRKCREQEAQVIYVSYPPVFHQYLLLWINKRRCTTWLSDGPDSQGAGRVKEKAASEVWTSHNGCCQVQMESEPFCNFLHLFFPPSL